jgi:pimeloyl-ACP methyl ester carboxylesterase
MRTSTPAALLAFLVAAPLAAQEDPPTTIRDVAVIDVVIGSLPEHRSVAIDDGRIAAVGPAAGVVAPAGAAVVDGTGRYLIPRLWDMPTHLLWTTDVAGSRAQPVRDTVRVAAPTGERAADRASVQAAFDAVQPGGTVAFAAGTYMIGRDGLVLRTPGVAAAGDTIRVEAPTGQVESDRVRVQDAFDRVRPGGVVAFASGTYVLGEGARLNVPDVTVLGHSDGTVLRGCDPERFEFPEGFGMDDVGAVALGCTGLFVLADRQTIRGLTFDHTWHGIYVGHLPSSSGEPPTDSGFGGHLIENNVFRYVPNGIRVVGPTADPTVIRDNDVVNAFHAFQSNGATVHIFDNRITVPEPQSVPASYHPESAVILSPGPASGSCEGSRVVGNVVEGTVHGIQILAGGDRGTCRNHEIRDNVIRIRKVPLPPGYPRHFRDFYFGDEAEGSAVSGTAIRLHGEVLGPADGVSAAITNVLIQDNRVLGGDGLGIQLVSASGNRVIDNHVSGIRRRSPFPGLTWGDDPNRWREANGSGIWASSGSDGNEIVGNTFEDIAGAAVVLEGDSNRVEIRTASDSVRDLGSGNQVSGPGAESAAPSHEEKFVDAGGVRLHYLDFGGEGLPVVFLHSESWDAHTYEDFAPRFTDRNRVLALTRRGYGKSEGHGGGYDVPTQAESIVDFLDTLGIERAVFAGNSSPTPLLTYLAERHPERVAGVVYLAGLLPWWQREEVWEADPTGALEMAYRAIYDPAARERFLRQDTYRPGFVRTEAHLLAVPALAFAARAGTIGYERLSIPLLLVGSPLQRDLYPEWPPSPLRAWAERLVDDDAFRRQSLEQIQDEEARSYLLRLAADELLQAAVQDHQRQAIGPAEVAGQERFRRAFEDHLRLVRLHVPVVEGYEYRDAPERIESHIRRFLEEVGDSGRDHPPPHPRPHGL